MADYMRFQNFLYAFTEHRKEQADCKEVRGKDLDLKWLRFLRSSQ